MANVSKLKTFLRFTGGARGQRNETPQEPQEEIGRDAIGVNGASVNDIAALVDLVPPPQEGPPVWAANRAAWNTALRTLGVESVADDEAAYEAAAYHYHALGGELSTAEDRGEEVDTSEGNAEGNEVFVPTEFAPRETTTSSEPEADDELEVEFEDGLEAEVIAVEADGDEFDEDE